MFFLDSHNEEVRVGDFAVINPKSNRAWEHDYIGLIVSINIPIINDVDLYKKKTKYQTNINIKVVKIKRGESNRMVTLFYYYKVKHSTQATGSHTPEVAKFPTVTKVLQLPNQKELDKIKETYL